MGFGGKASLIGCKIVAANRLPASFFVSVAYDCWAFRRLGVMIDAQSGAITKWLYRDPDRKVEHLAKSEGLPLTGRGSSLPIRPCWRGPAWPKRAAPSAGGRGHGSRSAGTGPP